MTGTVGLFVNPVNFKSNQFSTSFYIWNQHWSDVVVQSHKKWQNQVDSFHILAASFKPDKAEPHKLSVKRIDIDPPTIDSGLQNTFVFRVNGHQLPTVDDVLVEVGYLVSQGLMGPASRLEIDFDSPTRRLGVYREWLAELKERIDWPLGITVIPTWLSSADLKPLLDDLDYYVLQVHSVLSPAQGLFNRDLAQGWIRRFDRLTATPFIVSLPNYWYQAHYGEDKALMFLKAEQTVYVESAEQRDVFADPAQIARTIAEVESQSFKHLIGWIWFRMPTEQDQQIFSDSTMEQLMNGDYRYQNAVIEKIRIAETTANYDFWLVNQSDVDVVVDNEWFVITGCWFRHGVRQVQIKDNQVKMNTPFVMKPHEKLRIGWGQCQENL